MVDQKHWSDNPTKKNQSFSFYISTICIYIHFWILASFPISVGVKLDHWLTETSSSRAFSCLSLDALLSNCFLTLSSSCCLTASAVSTKIYTDTRMYRKQTCLGRKSSPYWLDQIRGRVIPRVPRDNLRIN